MIDIALLLWLSYRMAHIKNLHGRRFGRLTVIEFSGRSNGCSLWKCRCDCGTVRDFDGSSLGKGHTKSCGCLKRDKFMARITKHGRVGSPEYIAWNNMLRRCIRSSHPQYHLYGGRGIKVCDRWLRFENFILDVGSRPTNNHSIHRIDNDGDYVPSNVKWATEDEQQNCRSNNRRITFQGTTLNLMQWAEKIGVHYVTLHYRLKRGWSIERALTTPLQRRTNG